MRKQRTRSAATAAASGEDMLVSLLQRPAAVERGSADGSVVIGRLDALGDAGEALVSWPGQSEPRAAGSLVPLAPSHCGRAVALSFPAGSTLPLVLGVVQQPAPLQVEIDGTPRELALSANDTLTLQCGKASITLTADGQILLRGTYISSHSSGTQRIKGAAVRIN